MRALIATLSSNSGNFELIKPNTIRPLCGLWQMFHWFKTTRAFIIIFQEIAIVLSLAERIPNWSYAPKLVNKLNEVATATCVVITISAGFNG